MTDPSPLFDLSELLSSMAPRLNDGVYVYARLPAGDVAWEEGVVATFRESEGRIVVAEENVALQAAWPIVFRCAWITLDVRSDLQSVGLTAAVATALGEAGISCNVIAAVHHDHLFVPLPLAAAAMAQLQALQRDAASCAARRVAAASQDADLLRGIAYLSTAVVAMPEAELEALLLESRELNRDAGVTGVLLYNEGIFLQYFEGAGEAVRATYERICASQRHGNIVELLNQPITERSFEDWQMGFSRPVRAVMLALSTAQWERRAELARGAKSLSPGMDLLLSFWNGIRN